MRKFIKYSFVDLIQSYWTILYFVFFLVVTSTILYFSADLTKSIVSMMNIVLVLIPLVVRMMRRLINEWLAVKAFKAWNDT